MSDSPYEDLLAAIYEAPLAEPAWRDCLGAFRQAFEAGGAVLMLRHPTALERGVIITDGFPGLEGEIGDNPYAEQLYTQDPFINLPDNQVVTLADHVDMQALLETDFYRLGMEAVGIFHIAGVELCSGSDIDASLRLTRGKERENFDKKECALLQALVPHLKRALRIHSHIDNVSTEKELYAQAVSQFSVATFLLNDKHCLVESNPMGSKLLESDRGVSLASGKLSLQRPLDNQKFHAMVNAALEARARGDTVFAQAMPVYDNHGDALLGLTVRPLAVKRHRESAQEAVIAVFVSDAGMQLETPRASLTQLFGLTPAESRLATALANGLSLEDASQQLHISRNTARAHLRSIFAKTGVTQQTQLVSLILRSVAPLSP